MTVESLPTQPRRDEGALGPYLRAIVGHKLLVALAALAGLAGCLLWLAVRSETYEAQAEVLVTPLPQADVTFQGLQFLRDYGEATRTIQTAAALVDSSAAAELTARRLRGDWTRDKVADNIDVSPQGESSVLSVRAKAPDAREAERLANTFAQAALDVREGLLRRQVDGRLATLRARERGLIAAGRPVPGELSDTIGVLESVRNSDPTLSLSEEAVAPSAPVGAPAWVLVLMAIVAGFTIGTGLALLLEVTERRVRDEDELLSIYPLPVLTRTPLLTRRDRRALPKIPPAVREAFRTLRLQLERSPGSHRTVMLTSASSGDGKTTSAISLALSLVGGGHSVVLIDFDLRKPEVGRALGIRTDRSLVATLTGVPLSELLVSAPQLPPLRVVTAASTEGDIALLESLRRRLPAILEEARGIADVVVLDTAPLGEVSDALTIADQVDDLIMVTRPGHTNRVNLEHVRDLLASSGLQPTGYLVVGERAGGHNTYYTYGNGTRERSRGVLARSR
ncbi:MAG TPA: division plane positioning ATPase MipZ [Solirubrobacteraceae bacterium]|nr:division plane positioning ATPase MipZ [Solirubrobacteraceae bacterium]